METKKGVTIGIGSLVGLATLIGMGFKTESYFQTDAEAATSHFELASDNERGRLDNELKMVTLEINFLIRLKETEGLSTRDEERLDYLKTVRSNLEERLRDLAAAGSVST